VEVMPNGFFKDRTKALAYFDIVMKGKLYAVYCLVFVTAVSVALSICASDDEHTISHSSATRILLREGLKNGKKL